MFYEYKRKFSLKKEKKETEVNLKAISLFNIIIKLKFYPRNKPNSYLDSLYILNKLLWECCYIWTKWYPN